MLPSARRAVAAGYEMPVADADARIRVRNEIGAPLRAWLQPDAGDTSRRVLCIAFGGAASSALSSRLPHPLPLNQIAHKCLFAVRLAVPTSRMNKPSVCSATAACGPSQRHRANAERHEQKMVFAWCVNRPSRAGCAP
jgi:hypothetical protein